MPAARQRTRAEKRCASFGIVDSCRLRRSYTLGVLAARSVPDSSQSQIPHSTTRFATPSHLPSLEPPLHPRIIPAPESGCGPSFVASRLRPAGQSVIKEDTDRCGLQSRPAKPKARGVVSASLQHGSAAVQSLLALGQPLLTGYSVMPSTSWALALLRPPGDLGTRNETRASEATTAGHSSSDCISSRGPDMQDVLGFGWKIGRWVLGPAAGSEKPRRTGPE